MVCAFASQKQYMSLYVDTILVEKYRAALKGLSLGKSCVRFRRIEALPLGTIEQILRETVQGRGRVDEDALRAGLHVESLV